MTLLEALQHGTRAQHERVEARLGAVLLDRGLSRVRYGRLLERFWGFYAPVEVRIEALGAWSILGLDGAARRKTPLLERDLRAQGTVGAEPVWPAPCTELPSLDTVPQALGCMYVLEGATLGGAVVLRHLTRMLGVSRERGGAFFGSYGDAVGPMWKQFGRALAAHGGAPEPMVEAASETFVKLDGWILTQAT